MKFRLTVIWAVMLHCVAFAQNWECYPTVARVTRVAVMHDKAYIVSGNTLCVADTASVEKFSALSRLNGLTGTSVFDIRYASKSDRLAIVYTDGNIDVLTADDKIMPIPDLANNVSSQSHYPTEIAVQEDTLFVQTSTTTLTVNLRKGVIVRSADTLSPITSLDDRKGSSTELVKVLNANLDENQNWVKNGACMKLINNRLILTASTHLYYGMPATNGHISILDLDSNTWSQISRADVDKVSKNFDPDNYAFYGIVGVGSDDTDPDRYYVCCSGRGLFEFSEDTLSNYLMSRNCPEGVQAILDSYSRVSAAHGDADGNLWIVCSGIDEKQLRCRTASGRWLKMPITGFTNTSAGYIDMKFAQQDPYQFIWLVRSYRWDEFGGALYYRAGTDTITSDDESVFFTSLMDQDGNAINPQYLFDVMEDRNGAVWLLTSAGPCIVDSQVDFFNYAANAKTANIGKVRRVKIPRNDGTNLADYLLNNVETVCGVVDASNTKWIGTSSDGIYHLSADGLTQLDHFTMDNSPLFSNAIQALEYDGSTGKLYISVNGGLCVYKTDAIDGAPDNEKIYCYPNPVRPEYSGKLYICNLKDQSDIRITDASNHVIYQTRTYGGQTSWDLCNNSGKRVKPGIYYIYSIDANGKDGGMTKVLVQ